MINCLSEVKEGEQFNRQQVLTLIRKQDAKICAATLSRRLKKLVDDGEIIRLAKNIYYKPIKKLYLYKHHYSELAEDVALFIHEKFPMLDFRIFETVQLNDFLNHQIGKNTIMLSVEEELTDFVFDTLRDKYVNILLRPTKSEYNKYWRENTIVIQKLPTESPKGQGVFWHTCLEKLLVDVMCDKLITSTFSESEYPNLYNTAFDAFIVNELKLFRYAQRRKIADTLHTYLKTKTDVQLKVKQNVNKRKFFKTAY